MLTLTTRNLLINSLSFQLLWLLCVQGNNVLALVASAGFFLVHWLWVKPAACQWLFIPVVAVVGWAVDSGLSSLGVIRFHGSLPLFNHLLMLAPMWLFCLWLGFASTLLFSFHWFRQRLVLASALAFSCVPLSYFIGANFSASQLLLPLPWVLLIEACCWALLFPAGIGLSRFVEMKMQARAGIASGAQNSVPSVVSFKPGETG